MRFRIRQLLYQEVYRLIQKRQGHLAVFLKSYSNLANAIAINQFPMADLKDYKKYYQLKAEPEFVYKALTNPLTIALWTGAKAEMSTDVSSEFSLWDGDITGVNLEFEEGKRIMQKWNFGEQEEDSIVEIKLHENKKGTSVELRHTNIPAEHYEEFAEGWDEYYFGALQNFYEDE